MKNLMLITIFGSFLTLVGCKKINAAKGTATDHQVELSTFDAIDFSTAGHLNFTQSNTTSIVVNSNDKVFKALDIYVDNNTLVIKKKKGYIITNSEHLNITVTSPNINDIDISGSGEVIAQFDTSSVIPHLKLTLSGSGHFESSAIKATTCQNTISGSGHLSITNLDASTCQSILSGSGAIEVKGNATVSDLKISGSGAFKGFNLLTDQTTVAISGSGLAEVQADSALTATISGSGSVYYKGTPVVNHSSSGSGSLINAN